MGPDYISTRIMFLLGLCSVACTVNIPKQNSLFATIFTMWVEIFCATSRLASRVMVGQDYISAKVMFSSGLCFVACTVSIPKQSTCSFMRQFYGAGPMSELCRIMVGETILESALWWVKALHWRQDYA